MGRVVRWAINSRKPFSRKGFVVVERGGSFTFSNLLIYYLLFEKF